MSTETMGTSILYAVCGCCTGHADLKLLPSIVNCIACGEACSCEGCICEHDQTPNP